MPRSGSCRWRRGTYQNGYRFQPAVVRSMEYGNDKNKGEQRREPEHPDPVGHPLPAVVPELTAPDREAAMTAENPAGVPADSDGRRRDDYR
jgi:hypothetical protein